MGKPYTSCQNSRVLHVTLSMADPLSIALGVIPLVGVACKTYAALYKKISTFSHYSNAVARFQKQLKLQRRVFENEIHLLLRLAIHDDATIRLMRADLDHENWADGELEQVLRDTLGENYQPCFDIIEDIDAGLAKLQKKLSFFDSELKKHQLKVSPLLEYSCALVRGSLLI